MRCFVLSVLIGIAFHPVIACAEGLFEYEKIDFFRNIKIQYKSESLENKQSSEVIEDEWAEPIISSSGRISIYLPPKEVRSFLESPDSKSAKAYLEWNSRRIKKFLAAQEALRKETEEMKIMEEAKNQGSFSGDNKQRDNYLFYFMRKGCSYCAKQTPIIENIYLTYPEIKIEVFAKGYSDQELSRFRFPVMQDNGMSRLLKLTSYPAIAIFNKKKERFLLTGFTEKDNILRLFE
jgi:hypothetical protein